MIIKSLSAVALLTALTHISIAQTKLQPGIWRGALKTESGTEIPFNFDVTNKGTKSELAIINSTERFKVTDITGTGDSIFIKMPLFDAEFRLKLTAGSLKGQFIRHLGEKDVAMEFNATANTPYRFFKNEEPPKFNITGRWSTIIGADTTKQKKVGEFKQTGSKVTGTFLSTTGDYRYLEGIVSGDQLYLSCFDGGHAYLFTAMVKDAQTITNGKFYAGLTSVDVWSAVHDENAKLPDAFSLTGLKPGLTKLDFEFRDLYGKKLSINAPRFKNKVVIVQILGSWCPNCMDETAYMINYYKKYKAKGVEVVGLAYERTTNFAKSQKSLTQLKNRFNIPYPLLITGYTNNTVETAKSLPQLTKVLGFPTTIIIDKNGDVRKVHTGFSGPGTGTHYTEFIDEFEKITDDLLAEKTK